MKSKIKIMKSYKQRGGYYGMNPNNLDRILEAEELVKGLIDMMFTIQTAQQDKLVPITILSPFEAVLEKIHSLLEEVEKNEKNADK